jgi:pSer/pThr/pTyr-binding forkhead associated (FHA) protein
MDDHTPRREGEALPPPGPPPEGAELPAAFTPLRLVLQPGGPAVELTRPDMVLGRHSTADVRLPLPDVSRPHCRFVYRERAWQVFDLDSLNGVFVNGERVRQATLHDHDLLGIGGFNLKVELRQAPAAEPAPAGAAEADSDLLQRITQTMPRAPFERGPQRQAS